MHPCKVCNASDGISAFTAREMVFGTREEFLYQSCSRCGSLQIAEVPADLARHYPANYYSFAGEPRRVSPLMRRIRKWQTGRILARGPRACTGRREGVWRTVEWLAAAGATPESSILDVGCGSGYLLRKLASVGFSRLQGADPFISADVTFNDGVRLYKRGLPEIQEQFDCIILSHCLEHMPDPALALKDLLRIMRPGGALIIAIPLAGGIGHREYGPEWFGMNCPRHLVIPSEKGMRLLCAAQNLDVAHVSFYLTAEVLAFSEMYRRGIAKEGSQGFRHRDLEKELGPNLWQEFDRRGKEADASGQGDVAVFILRNNTVGSAE